jgi:hypothetical protein
MVIIAHEGAHALSAITPGFPGDGATGQNEEDNNLGLIP